MAVHPLRLINVVGALDFAKPSQINISKFLRQYSESLFFGLGLQDDFLPSLLVLL